MTCASLMPCADSSGDYSSVVDIFNVASGTWSTAALSQARGWPAATSLPIAGVAIFAGGYGTSCEVCLGCCGMGVCARGNGRVMGGVFLFDDACSSCVWCRYH
jgi:hypothetical protein